MGAMGRPSNTEQRRAEIVDGLLQVMAERGYQRATVPEIARAAGLSPGLLHYHFDHKQQILVALVKRLVLGLERRARSRLAAAGDAPRERLVAYVDAFVALGADADPRAVSAWALIGAEAVRDEEVRALYAQAVKSFLATLERLCREALRAEGRSAGGVKRIAAAILSAIEGAFRISAGAPRALPRGFASPTLRQMVHGLLDAQALGPLVHRHRPAR
jgi:TetR/AcrR family transcriptional repressor of bet genes